MTRHKVEGGPKLRAALLMFASGRELQFRLLRLGLPVLYGLCSFVVADNTTGRGTSLSMVASDVPCHSTYGCSFDAPLAACGYRRDDQGAATGIMILFLISGSSCFPAQGALNATSA